ncbi:MAG TPA: 3',5'-cyclic-nucleotide phosphodiesterase [Oxalicibacterium sp.]|nr:3',5'-cyclic-nucleotide phosphodiesterase [Oxalicibacterium sp.]
MKLHVMGCAGGIGGREKLTTCFRLDDDILLDAGTGVSRMDMAQLVKIDHIFLTHSHLDHVIGLAFLLDSVLGKRDKPVIVHASEKVIATLKTHMFNWLLWPDFAAIPDAENAIMRWQPMAHEEVVEVGGGRTIQSIAVNHTVETVSYTARSKDTAFLFTGDMVSSPELWQRLAADSQLRAVIIDCSFPDAEMWLAKLSKHFCPQLLAEDIGPMPYEMQFLITHLKPGQEELIMNQLQGHDRKRLFTSLKGGDVFEF